MRPTTPAAVETRGASTGRRWSRRECLGRLAGASLSLGSLPLLGCAGLAWPGPAPRRVPRIGYLDPGSPSARQQELAAFEAELERLGYRGNLTIELDDRYAYSREDRLRELARELANSNVELIVTFGTQATRAALNETTTTPIVMASISDPVGTGIVQSLARPGGNVTGLTSMAPNLTHKRLQLLQETLPRLSRVAYLWDPSNEGDRAERSEIANAAGRLRLALLPLDVTDPSQLSVAFQSAVLGRAEALVAFASGLISSHAAAVVQLAANHRLPAIYAQGEFVTVHGGLMAYGPNYQDLFRRSAGYVDKLLKGARPADLPVQQPTTFDFAVDLRAAQALGITIPHAVLRQATEILE